MANLTVSSAVDTMMQAADAPGILTAIGAAPLASPALTGTTTAPTPTNGDNTTKLATTAFVTAAVSASAYVAVANYAALPAASTVSGKVYLCLAGQGVYFINRKPAGLYYSNGTTWSYQGDLADAYFDDANTRFYDDADNTKVGMLDISGVSTGTTRTLAWPNKNGIFALTSDIPSALPPNGAAGGDLNGTYPNPGVAKVGGQTVSLAGSFTMSGAFTFTGTVTANTSVTFPTSGTLATLAGSETLSNKTLVAPALGTPASGNLSNCTADGTNAVGFLGIPQNSQNTGSYTVAASDNGKQIYIPSGTETVTLPANGSLALPVGFTVTFINLSSSAATIAITTDTMYLAGAGTTGSRTLAQYGVATATKIDSTHWIINGTGLT